MGKEVQVTSCKKCGVPIQNPAMGRPKDYCSPACRRLAEFEIRRLNRELDRLETQRIDLEQPAFAASELRDIYARTHKQQLADVQHSIATVEKRLRALLSAESEEKE
jgi:hypothetical protein